MRNTQFDLISKQDHPGCCTKFIACSEQTDFFLWCHIKRWCWIVLTVLVVAVVSSVLFVYYAVEASSKVPTIVDDPGWFLAATGHCSNIKFTGSTETPGFIGRVDFEFTTRDLMAFRDFPSHQSRHVPPGGISGSIDDLTSPAWDKRNIAVLLERDGVYAMAVYEVLSHTHLAEANSDRTVAYSGLVSSMTEDGSMLNEFVDSTQCQLFVDTANTAMGSCYCWNSPSGGGWSRSTTGTATVHATQAASDGWHSWYTKGTDTNYNTWKNEDPCTTDGCDCSSNTCQSPTLRSCYCWNNPHDGSWEPVSTGTAVEHATQVANENDGWGDTWYTITENTDQGFWGTEFPCDTGTCICEHPHQCESYPSPPPPPPPRQRLCADLGPGPVTNLGDRVIETIDRQWVMNPGTFMHLGKVCCDGWAAPTCHFTSGWVCECL